MHATGGPAAFAAFLLLAIRPALAGPAHSVLPTFTASTPQPATPDEVARLVHDLTTTREVSVQHVVSRTERVRFFTQRPCVQLIEIAEFTGEPNSEWVASLVGTLQLTRLDSLANLPLRACWTDTTRQDRLKITLGRGRHAITAYPNFADLACSWYRESIYLHTPLEPHVAALRALLHQALPRDTLLDDMPSCMPVPDSLIEVDEPPPFAGTAPPPDELPATVYKGHPIYPEIARRGNIEGTVVIQALVSREGVVLRTMIARSVPELDEEAVRAVEQWTFQPARTHGQPIAVWVAVPVDFRLH